MNQNRVMILKESKITSGPVLYWMSRDQRVRDNWALCFAQELALEKRRPLAVLFCLAPDFLNATIRQYDFMLRGLEEVERDLDRKDIPFILMSGSPDNEISKFVKSFGISALVTDFDPLRIKREWKKTVAGRISIPFYEIDAHNIVPCYFASPKQEYSAYTLRLKLKKLLPEFLKSFPTIKKHPFKWQSRTPRTDWRRARETLSVDRSVPEMSWIKPGEKAAHKLLGEFLETKIASYDHALNDPSKDGQSDLSAYLHFGQLSAQRVVLEVHKRTAAKKANEAFLEELIVRRELSDNFCFYNPHYDSFNGFPEWAQRTLNEHRRDKKEYIYPLDRFEKAATHDELWNAAQMEMAKSGKMHGYMRMYWCKKILEWSACPEEALKIAIYLNDRYELDGRDPNGYAGIAWSIGGVHDRPWPTRPVYGKIRSMTYAGCKSKFDIAAYRAKVKKL